MTEFYDKEMERLERQQKGLRDQYNALDNPIEEADYKKVINADLEFAPKRGVSWIEYAKEIEIYVKMQAKKNIQTHINGPKGAWYTHRNPAGCFACESMNLENVMKNVLRCMAEAHPDDKF